jgi:hypothetical protein
MYAISTPPAQADWVYIARMLEAIKSFQTEEAHLMQLEVRSLNMELKSVRLCQEKMLDAQLHAGMNQPYLSLTERSINGKDRDLDRISKMMTDEFLGSKIEAKMLDATRKSVASQTEDVGLESEREFGWKPRKVLDKDKTEKEKADIIQMIPPADMKVLSAYLDPFSRNNPLLLTAKNLLFF